MNQKDFVNIIKMISISPIKGRNKNLKIKKKPIFDQ